ncbi:MAG: hypothetical protein R3B95_08020 [Nitrospirales bacterium]|nr:hypothetical protein [Nitrospirales bacterium]
MRALALIIVTIDFLHDTHEIVPEGQRFSGRNSCQSWMAEDHSGVAHQILAICSAV